MRKKDTRLRLNVIEGGLRCETAWGSLRIVAAPESSPPFPVTAVALEEDTWLIISAEPRFCEPEQHPIRMMTDLINARKHPLGSVVVRNARPLQFLAIVHDVDHEPTWREEWVKKALASVFAEAERRKMFALGLHLLGTRHGSLKTRRFARLLAGTLRSTDFQHLRRLWVIAPVGINQDLVAALKKFLGPS
jgi:hypothetical protein